MIKLGLFLRTAVPACVLAMGAAVPGLRPIAWVTGLAFGLALMLLMAWGLRRTERPALSPADWVTMSRATLVGVAAELIADGTRPIAWLVALVGVALLLDGVDGQVARRTGTSSEFGARFDMEVDAFLLLLLSVQVSRMLGFWVLGIGLMRYAFVAATWAFPWLNKPLYPSMARKAVAAVQGVALVAAVSTLLPFFVSRTAVALALASLIWSFGRDTLWLTAQHRVVRPGTRAVHSGTRAVRPGTPAVQPGA